ncbi:MAG: LysR family transcriptional regulator, partial [Ruminiclostridium sp.]|nr:LysR family transcriptional regulator [Ruminiclostridium sp.]
MDLYLHPPPLLGKEDRHGDDEVETAVAVADSGKITSAAKELYLSPAAISTSIAALEQELNIELFH